MIRVITISREYGSGGASIAHMLGIRLRWRLIDDPLIAEIAHSVNTSPEAVRHHEEKVDPWFHCLVKALWRGGFVGAVARSEREALDADGIARLWNRVILEAAEMGRCVVVGRGGQCLLQRYPDTFHVKIYAPMSQRVKYLASREPRGTDLMAAARDRDRQRAEYIRHYFDQDWMNPHLYHLMLCSAIGMEQAVNTILCAAGLEGEAR
jgi:cytidylate kinase